MYCDKPIRTAIDLVHIELMMFMTLKREYGRCCYQVKASAMHLSRLVCGLRFCC